MKIPFLLGWTSINPSYDLGFTRYQGFDPSPYVLQKLAISGYPPVSNTPNVALRKFQESNATGRSRLEDGAGVWQAGSPMKMDWSNQQLDIRIYVCIYNIWLYVNISNTVYRYIYIYIYVTYIYIYTLCAGVCVRTFQTTNGECGWTHLRNIN